MELSTKNISQFKTNGIFVKITTLDNWLGLWAHLCDWLGSCSLSSYQILKIKKDDKFLVEA